MHSRGNNPALTLWEEPQLLSTYECKLINCSPKNGIAYQLDIVINIYLTSVLQRDRGDKSSLFHFHL